ncbi:TPA: type VI secretion system tip protein VgrG, partial [Vibrio cholerae]
MATLAYTIHIDGLGDETLVVTSFEGQESLSNTVFQYAPCYGFRYEIALASRQPHLSAAQVVDKSAELRMFRDGQLVQRVHGIVRAFSQGDIGHHYTLY